MPAVTFYMREVYGEWQEDILIAANEGKPSDQQFSNISEWERAQLRQYIHGDGRSTFGFVGVYRRWEADGKIVIPDERTMAPKTIEAKLRLDRIAAVDMALAAERTFKRVVMLGEKQLEWLLKALSFYKALAGFLRSTGASQQMATSSAEVWALSAGELVAAIIDQASVALMASVDRKEVEAEEGQVRRMKAEEAATEKRRGRQ